MTTETDFPAAIDLSKYVDMQLFGERPHLRGRPIPVATIAHSATNESWSLTELAYQYNITVPEVLAALLYYHENKAFVDTQEAAYQATFDDDFQNHAESLI